MKYMIMMFGDAATMMATKSPEWIEQMIAFMGELNEDLEKSGELAHAFGLADGSTAKLVSLTDGVPVATDGPFAESKESLIGFWIVDVESEARAIEIASRHPRKGGDWSVPIAGSDCGSSRRGTERQRNGLAADAGALRGARKSGRQGPL